MILYKYFENVLKYAFYMGDPPISLRFIGVGVLLAR